MFSNDLAEELFRVLPLNLAVEKERLIAAGFGFLLFFPFGGTLKGTKAEIFTFSLFFKAQISSYNPPTPFRSCQQFKSLQRID
jgi:hypothetical protein